jgi:hypothetical protein
VHCRGCKPGRGGVRVLHRILFQAVSDCKERAICPLHTEDPQVGRRAAAGYLAHAAYRLGLTAGDVQQWATSTLLGDFALDAAWCQVGLRMTTIRWKSGRMVPIAAP